MNHLYYYLKLLRISHWIKNLLVFLPLFFSGRFFDREKLLMAVVAFCTCCMLSSAIYVLNDIRDVEKDRWHEKKKKRPIASGKVSKREGWMLFGFCILAVILMIWMSGYKGGIFPVIYFILNLLYSCGLKDIPLLDIVILVSGFVLRVMYGASMTDIAISGWLYLTVLAISFYLSLGKRRNEFMRVQGSNVETRAVLSFYSYDFLDKGMNMCLSLSNAFYALWAMESQSRYLLWTVPVTIIISLRYCYDIEHKESDADPVEVILSDRALVILALAALAMIAIILYSKSRG